MIILKNSIMCNQIPGDWTLKPIGACISESRDEQTDDNPSERLTVRLHLQGVGKREERATDSVGSTKYFRRLQGQFIYGKQNLHKGAVGIVPRKFNGFSSSQDIPAFDFHPSIHPNWFLHYFKQAHFYEGLERLATGTGSKRIQPKYLYQQRIPTPPLTNN